MKTAVIIPCYNVREYCREVIESALTYPVFIIAINDGSTDGTKEILIDLSKQHESRIRLISFLDNRGKGTGLIEGFKEALFLEDVDTIITLDGDGQHKTSSIPRLIQEITSGAEMVIGSRDFTNMPPRSRFGNTIISWLLKLRYLKAPHDTQSGLRAFTRSLVKDIVTHINGGHYEMELRCLLLALRQKRCIRLISIPTIYLNKNRSSSFGKIKDSIRILFVLFQDLFTKAPLSS